MIRHTQGMVTINSTSGLRALQLGCPLKLLGEAMFDVPGLTAQATLDDFWRNPPKPDADLLADFAQAVTSHIQLRGVFYNQPGLDAAVAEAVQRLVSDHINQPL
jgi:capsular polysaccharide export protein